MSFTVGNAVNFDILDHVPLGILVLDDNYVIRYWNSYLVDWTGLSGEDVVGTDIRNQFPHLGEPKYRARLHGVFLGGPPVVFSSQLHKYIIPAPLKNGEFRIQHTTVTPIPTADNTGYLALFAIQDHTDLTHQIRDYRLMRDQALDEAKVRKQAEERFRIARDAAESANRAKSAFLANMSHELRTPLNAILGFSQLMARETGVTAEQRVNLQTIQRSGEHLLALINDVLEMSKIEAGQITLHQDTFDLHRLLKDVEDLFRLRADKKGISLKCDCDPDLPRYVRQDSVKLRQIVMNLLSNAVKFTSQGYIAVRAEYTSHPFSRLTLEVEDTGTGIEPENLETIFNPFIQTKDGYQTQEGTGLGLSISRQFARMLGGDLTVESQQGRGSIFRATLQIEPADPAPVQSGEEIRRAVHLHADDPAWRLLVVDDKESSRRLLNKLLTPLGFEVREAANGQEAVQLWEEWSPHLIWMDMQMPVMNGFEATQRIKSDPKGKDTVIVAVTASAFEEDRKAILSVGCDDFLSKPVKENLLIATLVKHLKVKFIYEDETLSPADEDTSYATREQAQVISTLKQLPPSWRANLQKATIHADVDLILQLIGQVRSQNSCLADHLSDLAQNFDHDAILSLLEQTEA